jgi:S1-C subfamily serine protease
MSINDENQYVPENGPIQDNAMTPAPAPKKGHGPLIAIAIATAAVVGVGGLGTAAIAVLTTNRASTSTGSNSGGSAFGIPNNTYGQGGRAGHGQQGIGQQTSTDETAATAATAAQKVGLVTINTNLDYTNGDDAAGTGQIISSDGYILTNNHVVESATTIKVTVESTNKTYTATVVATDTKADVALLKLTGASGLSTVKFAPTAKVTVGDSIYSVGNAEGTGRLVTAVGKVGATDQTLTVGSDSADTTETLHGLIELESDVVSGDSGGALFNTSGDVIGMVTAASTGSANVTGYAINIAQVLTVVKEMEAGTTEADITYGLPAFLGVSIASEQNEDGVGVESAFAGSPAATVGIKQGDTITAVNGTAVSTATQLSAAITAHKVGSQVTISWLSVSGKKHSATVTLTTGPAA